MAILLGTPILKLPKTYCIIAIKMLIFLGAVYHSVANGEAETATLRDHIQRNMDTYLLKHPNAMVILTGDFNPTSTGLHSAGAPKENITVI